MKSIKILSILFVLCLFAFGAQAQNNRAKGSKGKKIGNQEVSIKTSAQCDMCKDRIEKALILEKGIKSAVLDVDSKILQVRFNGTKLSVDQIRQLVAKTGYDADEVKANPDAYKALPACCQKDGMK